MEEDRYPINKLEECFHSTLEESEALRVKLRPELNDIVKRFYSKNQLSLIARLFYFNRFLFLQMEDPDVLEEIIYSHGTQYQRNRVADMISVFI